MAANKKAYDFQSYSAGNKIYGFGSTSPHMGTKLDPLGYRERDAQTRLRRNALLRRMKAGNTGNYMSQDWLGGPRS